VRPHGQHMIALSMLAIVGTTLPGCSPKGGGVTHGSEAISKSNSKFCYAYQLPPPGSPSPGTPLYVVLWRAKQGGFAGGPHNLLTQIHGHPVLADLDRKAVYALQPDYSLKELSLTPVEVNQVLSNLREAKVSMMQDTPVTRLQDDEVFRTKVASQLANVETPD